MQHDRPRASGAAGDRADFPRPPGGDVARLQAHCTACGDCAAVCPRGAIGRDDEGYPVLFDDQGCDCCGLCADVCSHGAIILTKATQAGLVRTMRREARMARLYLTR